MRIDSIAGGAPHAAGARAPGHPSEPASLKETVGTTRDAAMSAFHNDRFRQVLEWLSDPRASEAAMLMRPDEGGQTNYDTAKSRYAENNG
ncbi:hypothetical protein [Mesorhizobium sp. SP-1A]|uniref:hypothetical protein n=1 Tax=Mesorhizobium sp. SP-1A TaxID=3077840 RepID=UPI0028F6E97C|nr:hypothetical protein [Mesorhizobium sp. SP-1A]